MAELDNVKIILSLFKSNNVLKNIQNFLYRKNEIIQKIYESIFTKS